MGDDLWLDAGAYVAALEFATGSRAKLFGKPSPDFFAQAVAALGVPAHRVLMVGDDAVSDVAGAQRAGLAGALVQTGKFRPPGPCPAGLPSRPGRYLNLGARRPSPVCLKHSDASISVEPRYNPFEACNLRGRILGN